MNDDEPYAIEGVLLYLYTFIYPEWPTWTTRPHTSQGVSQQTNESKRQLPEAEWQTHLGMFKLADKLGLDGLKTEAQIRLRSAMDREWDASSFHELLGQLWEMEQLGVEALQDAALGTISANATQLMAAEEFRDELIRIPSFTARLAQELIEESNGLKEKNKQLEKEIAQAHDQSAQRYKAIDSVLDTWTVGQYSNSINKAKVQSIYDKWDDKKEWENE